MPTSPYAKLLVSVNGGAPTSGGITVVAGDTIQLSAESTVGWTQQRYEIWSGMDLFPLTCPAGWSTDGTTGVFYYSTSSTPPAFTVPAGWGKLLLRLRVNNGADNTTLCDDSTALQVLSPTGLYDIAWGETSQFSAGEKWIAAWRDDLRLFEAVIGGSVVPASLTFNATLPLRVNGGASANLTGNQTWTINAASGAAAGTMSAAHYTLVNNATATPTASTIAKWGASVDMGAAYFYGSGTVATTGVLRVASNVVGAASRDSGGSGNLAVWKYDGSDILQLGDVNAAGVVFNAKGTGGNAIKVLLDGATTPTRLSATAAGVGLFVAPDAGSGVDVLTIGVANTAPTAAPGSGKINAWGNSTTHALQVENADGVVTDAAPGVDTFESPTIFQVVDRLFFKKTTDGTTFHVAELTIPNQGIATLYVDCHVHKDGTDLAAYYSFIVRARLTGASVSVDDTPTIVADKDNIGAGQTIAGSTTATTLRVDIAGAAANNLTWSGRVHGIITKK
jgi:uncharacterized membrane protein